jgi:hypothetical protein
METVHGQWTHGSQAHQTQGNDNNLENNVLNITKDKCEEESTALFSWQSGTAGRWEKSMHDCLAILELFCIE